MSNPEELSTQFAEAMAKVQRGFKSIRSGGHHATTSCLDVTLHHASPSSTAPLFYTTHTLIPCMCYRMLFIKFGIGIGIGSTIVAFIPSIGQWEVSLVVMAIVPLLIGAASLMTYIMEPHTVFPHAALCPHPPQCPPDASHSRAHTQSCPHTVPPDASHSPALCCPHGHRPMHSSTH